MKKEELVRILNTAFAYLLRATNYKETRTRHEQARTEIVALVEGGKHISKIFNITECTSDCPLRQTPAYDSQYCNFYNKDLDHWSFKGRKKKKPDGCRVERVIVEESNG